MSRFLTTAELARILGLSDSTVRHYRMTGRITPQRQTPGGHARYDLDEVVAALGIVNPQDELRVTGLVHDTFSPLGVPDIRSAPSDGGSLAPEIVALGVRDTAEADARSTHTWGGRLLNARVPA
jgi:hypothetical protein